MLLRPTHVGNLAFAASAVSPFAGTCRGVRGGPHLEFKKSHARASPPPDLRAPFGGVKQWGIGREYGIWAMEEYTDVHNYSAMKN